MFSADAFGAATTGPDAEWKRLPLLTLEGSKALVDASASLTDLGAVMQRLGKELPDDALLRPGWPLIEEFFRGLSEGRGPLAFLKQFRDIENSALACFQAICSSGLARSATRSSATAIGASEPPCATRAWW